MTEPENISGQLRANILAAEQRFHYLEKNTHRRNSHAMTAAMQLRERLDLMRNALTAGVASALRR